jgi:hypothetical protein
MTVSRNARIGAAAAGALFVTAIGIGFLVFLDNHDDCRPSVDTDGRSIARLWNEENLDAIRRDLPAPTVHARNLFHASAAMWDAWAAYDPHAKGHFVDERIGTSDVAGDRDEAISYAAYRVLEARYIDSVGAADTIPAIDALMESLCYSIDFKETIGEGPAALGNRIAETILTLGISDGANETAGYDDPTYRPVNSPLIVAESGTTMEAPNRWQPLQIEEMISQNGIPVEDGVQEFIDPHWGHVAGFALPPTGPEGLAVDPGPPPLLGDPATDKEFKDSAAEVIFYSSILDPGEEVQVDISPGTLGDSQLGTNDGSGYPTNPVTGVAYAPNVVNRADYGRVLAEFWADGPNSETPPGHWNTVANTVSDDLAPDLRIGGRGEAVDRLEWDVKLYLALNGANHDAAIVGWGTKAFYDYVRPISMIRHMGGLGQSSDETLDSYHPSGLPLIAGLIELVTTDSSATGAAHENLADHVGEITIRAWTGNPADPDSQIGGVDWILAVDWVPYQKSTFVTPAFAGYVSGHSMFSRASAEILTAITGSEFFPEGLGEWTIAADSLEFEAGPESEITLQWASYYDASDQAGLSRLYGGIHVRADDLAGRVIAADIGKAAWELATTLFDGNG